MHCNGMQCQNVPTSPDVLVYFHLLAISFITLAWTGRNSHEGSPYEEKNCVWLMLKTRTCWSGPVLMLRDSKTPSKAPPPPVTKQM